MLEAILLGILQGLTEFLPISSSGHLVLGEHALGFSRGGSDILFEVLLHLGTLLAVLVAYRHDVGELLTVLWPSAARRLAPEERARRFRLMGAILVASVPAGVVGLTLKDPISELFGEPRLVAFLLLGTALILFIGDRLRQGDRLAEQSGPGRALAIGLAQALAILPGISRSGSTIVAGLAVGLRPVEAARFSFLIMLPAVSGAALLEFLDVLSGEARGHPARLGPGGGICQQRGGGLPGAAVAAHRHPPAQPHLVRRLLPAGRQPGPAVREPVMRPLVGITVERSSDPDRQRPWRTGHSLDYLLCAYTALVEAAGLQPVLLPVGRPPSGVETLVGRLDGLLLSGGSDLDPALWGEAELEPGGCVVPLTDDERARSRWEDALVKAALAADLPLLGICRGMQQLNVSLGGSLWQDLERQTGRAGHLETEDPFRRVHALAAEPGGRRLEPPMDGGRHRDQHPPPGLCAAWRRTCRCWPGPPGSPRWWRPSASPGPGFVHGRPVASGAAARRSPHPPAGGASSPPPSRGARRERRPRRRPQARPACAASRPPRRTCGRGRCRPWCCWGARRSTWSSRPWPCSGTTPPTRPWRSSTATCSTPTRRTGSRCSPRRPPFP
jgi:undecaprenyl-diphosphatase